MHEQGVLQDNELSSARVTPEDVGFVQELGSLV